MTASVGERVFLLQPWTKIPGGQHNGENAMTQMTIEQATPPAFIIKPADLSEKAQIFIEAHNITIKTSVSEHGDIFVDVGSDTQAVYAFWWGENSIEYEEKVIEEINQFIEGAAA